MSRRYVSEGRRVQEASYGKAHIPIGVQDVSGYQDQADELATLARTNGCTNRHAWLLVQLHVYGYSIAAIAAHQGVTEDAIRRRRLRVYRRIGKAYAHLLGTPPSAGPLTKRQAQVHDLRHHGHSYSYIGRGLGISREAARQLWLRGADRLERQASGRVALSGMRRAELVLGAALTRRAERGDRCGAD